MLVAIHWLAWTAIDWWASWWASWWANWWANGWANGWASNRHLDLFAVRNSSVLGDSPGGIDTLLNLDSLLNWNFDLFANSSRGINLNAFLDRSGGFDLFHLYFRARNFVFLLDVFFARNFLVVSLVFETINFFVDQNAFFKSFLDLVRYQLVLGDHSFVIDHLLDLDGFLIRNFSTGFYSFGGIDGDAFVFGPGGRDFFWDALPVLLIDGDHLVFLVWHAFLNVFVLKTIDFFVNADHFLAWNLGLVWLHFVASDSFGFVARAAVDWRAVHWRACVGWLAGLVDWTARLLNITRLKASFAWDAGGFTSSGFRSGDSAGRGFLGSDF